MKKDAKSRNSRAKRRNKRSNTAKAALIPAVVKAEGAGGKGPPRAKAEIPVAVKTSTTDAKPVSVATAEIPVEVNVSPKPPAGRNRQRRGKRTSKVTVMPMAVARTAQSRAKRPIRRRTPRRPQRVVVARREHKPVQNKTIAAPDLLGMVVSAATAVQETVVNAAAKLSLSIINGVESIIRKLFRFEERAATKVSSVVESIPRQAADTASRVTNAVDRLAAA